MAVKVLKTHPKEEALQAAGLAVLVNLTTDNAEGLESMVEAGMVDGVLGALRQLPNAAAVQGAGLGVLRNTTEIDDECGMVLASGGVDIAVGAMKRFVDDERVQVNRQIY